jgi:hypothetical protein
MQQGVGARNWCSYCKWWCKIEVQLNGGASWVLVLEIGAAKRWCK